MSEGNLKLDRLVVGRVCVVDDREMECHDLPECWSQSYSSDLLDCLLCQFLPESVVDQYKGSYVRFITLLPRIP